MLWILLLLSSFVQEDLKEIKPEDASKYQDQKVAVVMKVGSSSFLEDRNKCFLNSLKNFRDDKNFTIVLREEGLKVFAEKKIADPAKHFRNKKICVVGKIQEYRGKPQIVVEKFEQIKTLEAQVEDDQPNPDENKNVRKFAAPAKK